MLAVLARLEAKIENMEVRRRNSQFPTFQPLFNSVSTYPTNLRLVGQQNPNPSVCKPFSLASRVESFPLTLRLTTLSISQLDTLEDFYGVVFLGADVSQRRAAFGAWMKA